MKGVIINCPVMTCRKMLMKNVYLRPGSFLTIRCFHCGETIDIDSRRGEIMLSIGKVPDVDRYVDKSLFTEAEEDGMFFLSG